MKQRTIGLYDHLFEEIAGLGAEHTTVFDRICAFLLAMSPLLQFYKGPVRNAGFTVLLLVAPLFVLRLAKTAANGRADKKCLLAMLPMLFFQIFKMVDHGITREKLIYCVFFLVLFVAAAAGAFNISLLLKYATAVCLAATLLLAVQYFCFYILGFHLQLAPVSLFLPTSTAWELGVQTGLYGLRGIPNGFYRPSAFFMEPSHMLLYSFPVLSVLLLSRGMKRWRMITAALITFGLVLSTSGMGIVIAAGLWGIFIVLYHTKRNRKNVASIKTLLSARTAALLLAAVVLAVIMYLGVPAVRRTANRLVQKNSSGQILVISGRNSLANGLIEDMAGTDLVLGLSEDTSDFRFNIPGYHATMYKYGLIGIVLSYLFYVQFLFRTKGAGFWISAIILVLSFFTAHTHGTFFLLEYTLFLMNALYMEGMLPAKEGVPAASGRLQSAGQPGLQTAISENN